MGRDHIHMATGLPGDAGVISGCPEGTDVFLHIDIPKALACGIPCLLSGNDVILTPGVDGILPAEFIISATDACGDYLPFEFEDERKPQETFLQWQRRLIYTDRKQLQ